MEILIKEELKFIHSFLETLDFINPEIPRRYKIALRKMKRIIKSPKIRSNYLIKLTDSYFFAVEVLAELEELLTEDAMLIVKSMFVYNFCIFNNDEKRAEYFLNIVVDKKTKIKKDIIDKNYELAKLAPNHFIKKWYKNFDNNNKMC